MKVLGLTIITLSFFCLPSQAQLHDTSIFDLPIQMDEVVFRASQEGFDINAFIRRVRTDTTFYKAFKGLHLVPHTATNDIRIFDKKATVKASLFSHTKQSVSAGCRTMSIIDSVVKGDFFTSKGNYRYVTAELYASLFFTVGKVCNETDIVGAAATSAKGSRMEKSKAQLKQLIFNPGSRVGGVPFAGNKAAIFEEDMLYKYQFQLLSVLYDGEDCYLFTARPKPDFKTEVIYNELSTWFRKSDFAITARDYSLSYKTLFYDFDVSMKVRLRKVGGRLLPSSITYLGNWNIPMHQRERASFVTTFAY